MRKVNLCEMSLMRISNKGPRLDSWGTAHVET